MMRLAVFHERVQRDRCALSNLILSTPFHTSTQGHHYMDLAKRVDEALSFMSACGIDINSPSLNTTEFYTSHEALLLDYEEVGGVL